MASLVDEILERTVPDGACLLWTGGVGSHGYGAISRKSVSSNMLLVHRVVCGAGPGQDAAHLCGVRLCVNPEHLVAMDRKNHMAMDRSGGGYANADKTHCKHGHEFTLDNTYVFPKTGYRQCVACRKARNISNKDRYNELRRIRRGRVQ